MWPEDEGGVPGYRRQESLQGGQRTLHETNGKDAVANEGGCLRGRPLRKVRAPDADETRQPTRLGNEDDLAEPSATHEGGARPVGEALPRGCNTREAARRVQPRGRGGGSPSEREGEARRAVREGPEVGAEIGCPLQGSAGRGSGKKTTGCRPPRRGRAFYLPGGLGDSRKGPARGR